MHRQASAGGERLPVARGAAGMTQSHWPGSVRKVAALALASVLCAACGRPPEGPPARERAALARAVEQLEAARAAKLPVAVEVYAARIVKRFPASQEAQALRAQLPALRAEAERAQEARRRAELWRYTAAEHAQGFQLMAELASDAAASAPPLRLLLRNHPRFGRSVYLLIDDGADFACERLCSLQMAFDGQRPQAFAVRRALDNVPPAVFLRDEAAFFVALEDAEALRVDVPLASGERLAYRFDVGGYQPDRLQGDGSRPDAWR
jgi:hypothetical protein